MFLNDIEGYICCITQRFVDDFKITKLNVKKKKNSLTSHIQLYAFQLNSYILERGKFCPALPSDLMTSI